MKTIDPRSSPMVADRPLPFADFYLPFSQNGRRRLRNLLPTTQLELLTVEAHIAWEHTLLERLVELGTEALLLEFNRMRPEQIAVVGSPDCTLYNEFIDNLINGKTTWFQDYPVLENLITTTVDLWVDFTAEFIQRLAADYRKLAVTFTDGIELGLVTGIIPDAKDHYDGARSALIVTFSVGIEVVYKPKDLTLDLACQELLRWCNRQNISMPLRPLQILLGQGYGWQELVKQQSCVDRFSVQNFYHRAGMLLTLLYILGANNCESTSVIAVGEYPILIDADRLMSPEIIGSPEDHGWFHDSVMNTGILPIWNGDIYTANIIDFSVLGDISPKQSNSALEWEFINTDAMRLVPKASISPVGQNAVTLDGKIVSPQHYVENIVAGFQEIYQLFSEQQAFLLSSNSPLAAFYHLQSRFQLRTAGTYKTIGKQAVKPQYLRDHVVNNRMIDNLLANHAPTSVSIAQHPEKPRILEAEIQCLKRQGIPHFIVACNSTALKLHGGLVIEGFFAKSAVQRLTNKLQALSPKNMSVQVKLIRSVFTAKFAHLQKNATGLWGYLPSTPSLSPTALQQEAWNIGNDLVDHAIWDGDSCNWLALEYMFRANRYQLDLLNDSLYTGRAGVGLFLAALAKASQDKRFQQVALGALEPFRRSIRVQPTRSELLKSGLGLLGWGGMIYSMVKVGQFLPEATLLEDAVQTAQLLTPAIIASDQKLDVIWGVAGGLLGLLSLYQATQDRSVLEIAVLCGEHLLANRSAIDSRAWLTIEEQSAKPLTGFSHGAAGCSLALLRLYAAAGDARFLAAAQAGIAYEQSVFDETVQNWPDFRLSEQRGKVDYLNTWCHGSTGIGLARLGGWSILSSPEVCREIEIALTNNQKNGIFAPGVDHLCCGNVGRIELLVLAGQLLGDPYLLKSAQEGAEKMVITAKNNGAYRLLPHLSDARFSPGLYKGSAGIGYQLLRISDPDLFPSVAIWE